MKRSAFQDFESWKQRSERKPLILRGARQVGKTYLMKKLGRELFSKVHYFNFEKQPQLNSLFVQDLDPLRITSELEILSKNKIEIQKDLVIFDEIQQAPKALNSLKYFAEDLPSLHICAAGSLLGLVFSQEAFPVGKVEYLDLHPLSYTEFLWALGEADLATLLDKSVINQSPISEIIHEKLWTYLKWYFIVGGLPEVVRIFMKEKSDLTRAFSLVRKKQTDLVSNYYADMAKHCGKINASHIQAVLQSVPRQLAKNQDESTSRFRFKDIIPGLSRMSQLDGPIQWLEKAGIITRVPIVERAQFPLITQVHGSFFKLYLFDVGLLGALSDLSPTTLLLQDYGSYKGYFAENFVAQQLEYSYRRPIYSWNENTAEIEFLCEINGAIYPIEVKSGAVVHSKSLRSFLNRYPAIKKAAILSGRAAKFAEDRTIDYFPLYTVNALIKAKIL